MLLQHLPPNIVWASFQFLELKEASRLPQLNKAIKYSLESPAGDSALWRPRCMALSAHDDGCVEFADAEVWSTLGNWRTDTFKDLYRASATMREALGFWTWGINTHRGAMLLVALEKRADGGYDLVGRVMRPSPAGIGQTVLRFEGHIVFLSPITGLKVGDVKLARPSVASRLAPRMGCAAPPRGATVMLAATSMAHDTAVYASHEALLFTLPTGVRRLPAIGPPYRDLILATSGDFTRGGVVICQKLPAAVSAANVVAEQQRRRSQLYLKPVDRDLAPVASVSRLSPADSLSDEMRRRIPGLYYGIYGPHGCEVIAVRWRQDGALEGLKVTGDHNVPAGELTFEGFGAVRTATGADVACNCMFDCDCIQETAAQEDIKLLAAMNARTKTAGFNYAQPTWNAGRLLFLCAGSEREYLRRQMQMRRGSTSAAIAETSPAEVDLLHPPVNGMGLPEGRAAHRSISILLVFDGPTFRKSTVLRPFSA